MATNYKVLGQSFPVAATQTTLYTAPALTQTVCSTIAICNLGATTTFRIAIQPGNAALTDSQYIAYDAIINASDSKYLTIGITLAPGDVISVYSTTATISFNLFGTEIV